MTNFKLHMYNIDYELDFGSGYDEESKIKAKPVIYLYCRDDEGNKIIKTVRNFRPYFYIEPEKPIPIECNKYIDSIEETLYTTVKGTKCKKLFCHNPRNVPKLRDILNLSNITTYEDDIVYVLRFLIDKQKELEEMGIDLSLPKQGFRQLTIDIETTTEFGFPDPATANEKITVLGNYDNYTKTYSIFAWHPNIEKWRDKFNDVKTIKAFDDKNKIFVDCTTNIILFDNEVDMIKSWLDYYQKINPDLLLGWNSQEFDIPYILNRLDKLKINKRRLAVNNKWVSIWMQDEKWFNSNITGRVIFDVMKYYKDTIMNEKPSYSLDNVAKDELGEGKAPMINHMDSWLNDFKNYILYNIKDIELCYRIADKRDMIKFVNGLRVMVGCNFSDFKYFSRLVDLMILKLSKKENIILPSKPKQVGEYIPKDKREAQFTGAYVLALPGRYKNICALDIKTLYPLTIKTLNLSYETIIDDNTDNEQDVITVGPHKYTKKFKGILAKVVDNILQISAGYKKLRNESISGTYEYEKYSNLYECAKFIVVTLYGVQGNKLFRLFDTRNAETITYVGREIVQYTQKIIEKEGHKVILMDTDSTYINLQHSNSTKEECITEGLRLKGVVNKSYDKFAQQFNIDKHFFETKFEVFYEKMIVGTKKRYGGKQIWREGKWENYTNIKGFEVIKSTASKKTKHVQKKVLEMLFEDSTYQEVKDFLFNETSNILNDKTPIDEIGLPTSINQDEHEKSLPIDRGKKWSNNNINTNFKIGDKPLLVYVKSKHNETDAVCFEHDYQWKLVQSKGIKLDKERMIERVIFMPLNSIIEAVKWDMKKLKKEWSMKCAGQITL